MKHLLVCVLSLLTFSNCTDKNDEWTEGEYPPGIVSPPSNDVVREELFEVLNLDYPGLEQVKDYYEADEYYLATHALLEYYRMRTTVQNPHVSLLNVTATDDDRLKADYALDDYRFFVNNYYEDADAKKPYSLKKDGNIDWNFRPEGADDEYQKQLHRHQWYVPQARVYRATGEERYLHSWMDTYTDWLLQNSMPSTGTNTTTWWQLQAAERVSGQVELFDYYKNSVNFTPQWLSVFLVHFAQHADFLKDHPYESGNILISQANALTFAGVLFPELKNASLWLDMGTGILGKEVKEQFLGDGMHVELDLSYHIAALADFYDVMKLLEYNNLSGCLPADSREALRKATEVVMHFTWPVFFNTRLNGACVPGFNDTRPDSWTCSVLTRNFKRYTELFPDHDALLYMASAGAQGSRPDLSPRLFDRSGYYVLRNGWEPSSTVLIHSNNYSDEALRIWSHNQPDNGTFELYHNGRNFFPDTGVYAYYTQGGNNSDRIWYRQTRVHNTQTLDNEDIFQAKGQLLGSDVRPDWEVIVTENEGYTDLKHRRYIFFVEKEFFVLVDEGVGTADGTVSLHFNLCEGGDTEVILDTEANGAHTAFADGNNLLVRSFSNCSLSVEPFDGQVSYRPGVTTARKAYSVQTVKSSDQVARFITVLYPVQGSAEEVKVSAEFLVDTFRENGVALKVTVGGRNYELNYEI